jgi:hypothetical protein
MNSPTRTPALGSINVPDLEIGMRFPVRQRTQFAIASGVPVF